MRASRENLVYPYRQSIERALLGILFSVSGCLIFGGKALYEDRGLIIDYIIRLDASQARIFWAVSAILTAISAILFSVSLIVNRTIDRSIVLGARAISLPRYPLSMKATTIPYRDIVGLNIANYGRTQCLYIYFGQGHAMVPSNVLPNEASFDELYAEMSLRTRQANSFAG